MDILSLFVCFETLLSSSIIRHLTVIIEAMFSMIGRITMLSLARWAGIGSSYRTIKAFSPPTCRGMSCSGPFFGSHLFNAEDEYIVAGDEGGHRQSRKNDVGTRPIFSVIKGRVINEFAFFVFALVNVNERKAAPVAVWQTVRSAEEKAAAAEAKKKKRRPK